ncbi:MAG: AzlD domain-containing protein [Victivallales bacterium]|nr:AzlD domain-containing protein [Victivallales bacterium]MBR6059496.1 AzlD domain-containing protein [Victivallales bacterium]
MPELTLSYLWAAVIIMFLVTYAIRGFVFAAFGGSKKPPKVILYLGSVISPAVICMLVVYCFRDTKILTRPYGLPEIIACAVCIALHLWRRNPLLSIIISTVVYMTMLQWVFA